MPELFVPEYTQKQKIVIKEAADAGLRIVERVESRAPDPQDTEAFIYWLLDNELLDYYLGMQSWLSPESLKGRPNRHLLDNQTSMIGKIHEAVSVFSIGVRLYRDSNGNRIVINPIQIKPLTENLDALYYAEDPQNRENKSSKPREWDPDALVIDLDRLVVDEVNEHTVEESYKYSGGKQGKMERGTKNYGDAFSEDLSLKFGIPRDSHLPVDPERLYRMIYTFDQLHSATWNTTRFLRRRFNISERSLARAS